MEQQSLTLVRGVQGAGKTSFGLWLIEGKDKTVLLAADHFFTDAKGKYHFDAKKLGWAHKRCQEECQAYLEAGYSVIVTNTMSKESEIKPYLDLAAKLGVRVYSVIMEKRHDGTNIHGVPETKVKEVEKRFSIQLNN